MQQNENDLRVAQDGHIAIVEICRPPNNYLGTDFLGRISDVFENLESEPNCRAIVLAAQGKSFCAGSDLSNKRHDRTRSERAGNPLYEQALRIIACSKPFIAAVQGPAIGAGLGLALLADFRVSCEEAVFCANFSRLGIHPGFGISLTLPRVIGVQNAALLLYTGRRIHGDRALNMGLVDLLVDKESVVRSACDLALEIAAGAPLAVYATRKTLRQHLLAQMQATLAHESEQQKVLFDTADFREGVSAAKERRAPVFIGQ